MAEGWLEARDLAIAETDRPNDQFPESYPFTLEQVLSPDFWPPA